MGEVKHTPGPWSIRTTAMSGTIEETARWNYQGGAAVLVVAEDDCETHPVADCSCNHTCREQDQCEANARLIAASPEMAEELGKIHVTNHEEDEEREGK